MGYRSDVAYVIKFDSIEKRDAFVSLMLAKNEQAVTEALECVAHDNKADPIITFYQQGWKWYDGYEDVQAHHRLMEDAAELFGAEWRFVRIGEDANDIDIQDYGHDYDLWEYVDPVTTIRTSF